VIRPKTKNPEQDRLLDQGKMLPIMEEFYSIQGEGFNTGEAAYFIRVGGCDVGCRWCDVKESWNPDLHPLTYTDGVIENALKHPSKTVVVTGGEPLIYNMGYLCEKLQENGVKTCLETSGAYPLSGSWDWICLSPKRNNSPVGDITQKANELKVIIFNDSDLAWAEQFTTQVHKDCVLFLQPEWSRAKYMTPVIIDYVMKNPRWKISIQSHKFMNIP
jgi:organic radical activating enzyme